MARGNVPVTLLEANPTAPSTIVKTPALLKVASPDKATAAGLSLALPTIILPDVTVSSLARVTSASLILEAVIASSTTVVAVPAFSAFKLATSVVEVTVKGAVPIATVDMTLDAVIFLALKSSLVSLVAIYCSTPFSKFGNLIANLAESV